MENQDNLESNKAFILNHFDEFVNKKNSSIAMVNFSPDFLDHDEMNGPAIGPEAAKKMMEGAYKIWPDLHVSVEDIIAEGDKVMVRNIWRGTFDSGKKIEFHGFVLWKIKDGKITERWATVTAPADEKQSTLTWLR